MTFCIHCILHRRLNPYSLQRGMGGMGKAYEWRYRTFLTCWLLIRWNVTCLEIDIFSFGSSFFLPRNFLEHFKNLYYKYTYTVTAFRRQDIGRYRVSPIFMQARVPSCLPEAGAKLAFWNSTLHCWPTDEAHGQTRDCAWEVLQGV